MIEHYIRGFEEELREIRHQIHENPELGLQEFKTSALVAEKLRQWGYEVEQGLATTGVVATLKVGDGEKSIGLRADMDALPIYENSGKPWASKHPGLMHACGHDGIPPYCWGPRVILPKPAVLTARYALSSSQRKR